MHACRVLVTLIAAAGVALFSPAVASAAPYPAGPPSATVSAAVTTTGGRITFSGTGFMVDETVTIDRTYSSSNSDASVRSSDLGQFVLAGLPLPTVVIGNVTADATGSFSTQVQLGRTGTALLTASGVTSHVTASATVLVVAASSDEDGLPTTGNSRRHLQMEIGAAVAAILLGSVVVWLTVVWRRRSVPRS